jgi:sugar lactone lactonase YvrE
MFVVQTVTRRSLFAFLMIVLSAAMIAAVPAQPFPNVISLPNGFQPEGIAAGKSTTFYVGSIPTGAIYRGDVRTGEGEVLVAPQEGRSAIGLKYNERTGLLVVAGGATGYAYVYDGQTGANVAEIQLTTLPSFINDVALTKDAAYFTNSSQPEFYRVSVEERDGQPEIISEAIRLSGDYEFVPDDFNANGIAVIPNEKALIIVNSANGALYKVDPTTGNATLIYLDGATVPNGDGILLQGRTLYVVQNFLNQISVVKLNSNYTEGDIVGTITRPEFDIPTTIARFGNSLYAVNARFGTEATPDTEYEVVRVSRK